MVRTALATVVVLIAMLAGVESPLAAKFTTISLADLAHQAEFIGVVRVDRISLAFLSFGDLEQGRPS